MERLQHRPERVGRARGPVARRARRRRRRGARAGSQAMDRLGTRRTPHGGSARCAVPHDPCALLLVWPAPRRWQMESIRSALSATACSLVDAAAKRLGPAFDPLADEIVPHLLNLGGRSNRVFIRSAEGAMKAVAEHCQLVRLLPTFRPALVSKSVSRRQFVATAALGVFTGATNDGQRRRYADDIVELAIAVRALGHGGLCAWACGQLDEGTWPAAVNAAAAERRRRQGAPDGQGFVRSRARRVARRRRHVR